MEQKMPLGTTLTSPVVGGALIDMFGTHYDWLGVGGWRPLDSVASMQAIPVSAQLETSYSSGMRRRWMRVFVWQDGVQQEYQLAVSDADWQAAGTEQAKIALLADNNRWLPLAAGSTQKGQVYQRTEFVVQQGGVQQFTVNGAERFLDIFIAEVDANNVPTGNVAATLMPNYGFQDSAPNLVINPPYGLRAGDLIAFAWFGILYEFAVIVNTQRNVLLANLPPGANAADYEYQFRPAPTVNAQRQADLTQTLAAGEAATDYEFQTR